jgi:hypothetical protein
MLRRAVALAGLSALVLAGPGQGTAGGAGAFGDPATVVAPGCDFPAASGDAVVGADGVVRGFASFSGGDCQPGRIWYLQGSRSSWTATPSPYTGEVMGVAWDGSATYLLHAYRQQGSHTRVIRVTKRDAGGFTPGRTVAVPTPGEFFSQLYVPQGDIVALGGRWWAVWNEPAPPDDSLTKLFQARTLGTQAPGGVLRRQVTFHQASPEGVADYAPSLTLAPGSGPTAQPLAVLAWEQDNYADATWVKLATAGYDGRWRSRRWSPNEGLPYVHGPALTTYGDKVVGAYSRPFGLTRPVQRAAQVTDPHLRRPSTAVGSVFSGGGSAHRIASSMGHTFVAWNSPGGVRVGDTTAPGRRAEVEAVPGAKGVRVLALTARHGKATVLGFSFRTHRVWAATQR